MLDTNKFGQELKELGFNFYSVVPCSFLKDLINYAINSCDYIMATNEGDAVAICAGAYIGGRKPVVMMQNSGLGNAVSPLVSLNYVFRIPVLGFISLRGEDGINDEPQHELMGKITEKMLETMSIKWEYLSKDFEEAKLQIKRANEYIENNQTFFFIVKEKTFEKEKLKEQNIKSTTNILKIEKTKEDALPTRFDTLKVLNKQKDNDTVYLASTGKAGRELFTIEDIPNNLYMVGSMGCASSMALGISLTNPSKSIITIDGDGAFLMRMGALPTNAYYSPKNMLHILLDNNVHDSTGGQLTVSNNIDFINIASASGYKKSIYVHNLKELEEEIIKWKKEKELTFLYLKISAGSIDDLGRPNIKPFEVKERLIKFLKN